MEEINMEEMRLWTHNQQDVEDAILGGEETDDTSTQYGANEFAVDFLREENIWDKLLLKPKRGKENGKDWKKLGGIAVLLELLHTGRLAKADKVIKDSKLMMELGFTIGEVEEKKEEGKGVLHRDTMRNYYKAIPQEHSIRSFYDFTYFMRKKRWIRKKVYAADGFKIIVEGKTYEGAGKIYDDKKGKWIYGYKVVILMNIEEERERIIGFAIGSINMDERELLLKIFKDLKKYAGKIKDIIDVIILDRGYWGYDFLEKTLAKKYKIDYVVIAKKNFTFVKEDLRSLIDNKQIRFENRRLYSRTKKEREDVQIGYAEELLHGYINKKQPYQGLVNVVILKKKVTEKGKEKDKEIFYVTNKNVKRNPLKIVELYGSRWSVENKGIRELSQKWLIRVRPGRTLNAITARMSLVLMLYNAMKIMEMKHGKEWQKNEEEIKSWGERSFIGGQCIVVYTKEYFGMFTTRRYRKIIEERTRKITERNVIENILKNPQGHLPRDKLDELKQKLFS